MRNFVKWAQTVFVIAAKNYEIIPRKPEAFFQIYIFHFQTINGSKSHDLGSKSHDLKTKIKLISANP